MFTLRWKSTWKSSAGRLNDAKLSNIKQRQRRRIHEKTSCSNVNMFVLSASNDRNNQETTRRNHYVFMCLFRFSSQHYLTFNGANNFHLVSCDHVCRCSCHLRATVQVRRYIMTCLGALSILTTCLICSFTVLFCFSPVKSSSTRSLFPLTVTEQPAENE